METTTTATTTASPPEAVAAAPAPASSTDAAKRAIDSHSNSAVDVDIVDDSNAPSPPPVAQPPAPDTPSVAPAIKQEGITTLAERERAAREVLQALTASSSLAACGLTKAASGSRDGGGGNASTSTPSARRVLFTADDADSEEDFASDDSDAVETALRRARGKAAAVAGGGSRRRPVVAASSAPAAGDRTATTAATVVAPPKGSSLQPANASARRLDAVFDGALRQAYFHGNDDDDDDDDEFGEFEDNNTLNNNGGGGGNSSSSNKGKNNNSSSSNSSLAARNRDKSDRATVETVLDPRTRLVLFKLLNNGVFASIHGCVSTGKEANVYLALPGPSKASSPFAALAVKVYKTSILAFKDRERYVEGDARFSGSNGGGGGGGGFGGAGGKGASSKAGYCKGNARKMVRAWAEKEARNLARLAAAGVRAPAVVCLRSHVLAMEFVSDGSFGGTNAAPRLKDARLSRSRAARCYRETLGAMRAMWSRARLVHADLSEYNMLYAPVRQQRSSGEGGEEGAEEEEVEEEEVEEEEVVGEGKDGGDKKPKKKKSTSKRSSSSEKPPTHSVVVIDVSQSVDLDHPRALEFLKVDANNVNSFFARRGVPPLTTREVFDFVTADAGAYPDQEDSGSGSSSSSVSTPATTAAKATPFTAVTAATATSCADFDPNKTSMMTKGEEKFLDLLLKQATVRSEASVASGGALQIQQSSADVVWASAHIPRRLADVADAEGDALRLEKGGGTAEGIYYQRFAGMSEDMGRVKLEEEREGGEKEVEEKKREKKKKEKKEKRAVSFASEGEQEEGAAASDDASSSSSSSGSDSDSASDFSDSGDSDSDASDSSQRLRRRSLKARACNLPPEEADAARALRKAAKAEAKAGARERRKTKTPKHVKKRAAAKARKKKK